MIAELAGNRWRGVIVVPIGFVSDHVEVIWDLDNEARESAESAALFFARVATPGTDPRFVAALADLVQERLDPDRSPASLTGAVVPGQVRSRLLPESPPAAADHLRRGFGAGLGRHGRRSGGAGRIRHRRSNRGVMSSSTVHAGTVRVGTRGSALATTQSGQIVARLAHAGVRCELVPIRTRGDVDRGPLATIGGTGVFVTAVRDALLAGDVDVAVHSYKDLPTASSPGIRLAAVPTREDPADVLCARDGLRLADLPPGATVGTGSPRRRAQLLALRPDLEVRPVRGNVDTRLSLVRPGRSTRSCWRRRDSPGSTARPQPPSASPPHRCCRPPPRGRWPSSAGMTTLISQRFWRVSTMP